MSLDSLDKITLYTSRWCRQARDVEQFIVEHGIAAEIIRIDGNSAARQALIEINDGYASVPTLLFPDGSKLVEPSLSQLEQKLQVESAAGRTSHIKAIVMGTGE
jgi:glutaredoxin